MVVAEGMGDEHCQASGAEKSHRRTGTTARRDYASHVEGWNRVPLDKGNGADNLSDERQTVGATKPQSSATMSLAGRWMRRVRFGLLCRSLYRDQYASQMMRVGLFQPVHVKTLASQKRRALLAARKILQEKALAIENDIRGLLRNFGLKVGIVGVVGFEQRIHELVEGVPELADIMEPLLAAR